MGISGYMGLAAEEFNDIHEAVAEAMAYVVLPIMFYVATPGSVDSLYGEATPGSSGDNFLPYGDIIHASIKVSPTEEELTKLGLLTGAAILGFIPQWHVRDWEANTGLVFAPSTAMEVEYQGTRYNMKQYRTDYLPIGDGTDQDTIGPVFTAETKPRK